MRILGGWLKNYVQILLDFSGGGGYQRISYKTTPGGGGVAITGVLYKTLRGKKAIEHIRAGGEWTIRLINYNKYL